MRLSSATASFLFFLFRFRLALCLFTDGDAAKVLWYHLLFFLLMMLFLSAFVCRIELFYPIDFDHASIGLLFLLPAAYGCTLGLFFFPLFEDLRRYQLESLVHVYARLRTCAYVLEVVVMRVVLCHF
jgi:hypothetical protein